MGLLKRKLVPFSGAMWVSGSVISRAVTFCYCTYTTCWFSPHVGFGSSLLLYIFQLENNSWWHPYLASCLAGWLQAVRRCLQLRWWYLWLDVWRRPAAQRNRIRCRCSKPPVPMGPAQDGPTMLLGTESAEKSGLKPGKCTRTKSSSLVLESPLQDCWAWRLLLSTTQSLSISQSKNCVWPKTTIRQPSSFTPAATQVSSHGRISAPTSYTTSGWIPSVLRLINATETNWILRSKAFLACSLKMGWCAALWSGLVNTNGVSIIGWWAALRVGCKIPQSTPHRQEEHVSASSNVGTCCLTCMTTPAMPSSLFVILNRVKISVKTRDS